MYNDNILEVIEDKAQDGNDLISIFLGGRLEEPDLMKGIILIMEFVHHLIKFQDGLLVKDVCVITLVMIG